MMPMFLIPIPFICVLLILLLRRSPKVGVWVVGGLICVVVFAFMILLPVGMHDGFMPYVLPDGGEILFFAIPLPFLFVLLFLLLHKSPKAGAMVIVAVVVTALLGAALWLRLSRRNGVYQRATIRMSESAGPASPISPIAPPAPTAPSVSSAPIWSEGIEQEFEADVYPSRRAAVRALGLRLQSWVHSFLTEDANHPTKIVLFQEEHDRSLLWELERTLEKTLLGISCSIEASSRNTAPNEIGITLRVEDIQTIQPPPWSDREPPCTVKGRVVANARRGFAETTVVQSFSEKPWVEDFASFANERPDRQFLVARSQEACTSENEAKSQALRDACDRLRSMVGQRGATVPGRSPLTVNPRDVQEGGFLLDQFVQSFDGAAGRIWRHAVLIDASAPKLAWLNKQKTAEMHGERVTWAHIIVSALGVLVVIVVAYLFLNMATKGYYEWTLRIAGTVLAIAGIIAIFLVLR